MLCEGRTETKRFLCFQSHLFWVGLGERKKKVRFWKKCFEAGSLDLVKGFFIASPK